jgi:DUF2959 family protein
MKEKHNRIIRFGWMICLAASAVWVTGCSSTGYKKSSAAAVSMQSASGEVQAESRALELTMSSLKDLVNEPGPDLKVPYQRFDGCLKHLIAAAGKSDATGRRMVSKNEQYFQDWDRSLQTIDYESIRDVSQTRRAEVSRGFEAVNKRYSESQDAMRPLISYLKDIRKALNSDLTPSGIESIKKIVQNAESNAGKVQTALTTLNDELVNSGAKLSSFASQNPEMSNKGHGASSEP